MAKSKTPSTKFLTIEIHTTMSNADLKKIRHIVFETAGEVLPMKRKEAANFAHAITQIQVAKAD